MEEAKANNPKILKWFKLLLKIAVSIACLWYVFAKVEFREILNGLKNANPFWLIFALFIYSLSKFIGARRLSINFKNIGVHFPEVQNIKLYWLGMFYNLFLPGAITGDAYKVIVLSKRFNTTFKKITAAVILDRLSGLLSLGLLVAITSCFVLKETWIKTLLITGALIAIPILYFIIKKFFSDFLPGFWSTFFLGALVQLAILVCIYSVLMALNIQHDIIILIFVFLVAVIISVLPISIGGGLGVREFAIIEGAKFAGLEIQGQQNALVMSLLFYFITLVCSLVGIVFVINDPFKNKSVN